MTHVSTHATLCITSVVLTARPSGEAVPHVTCVRTQVTRHAMFISISFTAESRTSFVPTLIIPPTTFVGVIIS